jgi:hypothetical protein
MSTVLSPTPANWNINRLLTEVQAGYASEGISDVWAAEEESVRRRLESLRGRLSVRYQDPKSLGIGGSGIVLKLTDTELSNEPVALKFPRPVQGQMEALAELLNKEVSHLVTLRHSSIVRLRGYGTLLDAAAKFQPFPYYVMDFIDGAKSQKYMESVPLDDHAFYDFLDRAVDALAYLHANSTLHLDVKPDNVLVTKSGVPIISDLGTAKKLDTSPELTLIALTRQYAAPEAIERIDKNPSDPNRTKGWVPKNELRLEWDLTPLGRTVLNWLGYQLDGRPAHRAHHLTAYCRKFVLLLAARCLRSAVPQWLEDKVGLDRRLLIQIQYTSLQQVLDDVGKMSGRRSLEEIVPELNGFHPDTLQVAAGAPTTYSPRLKLLVECVPVRRLAAISQLGLVSQVYPTATHSRLEHSLGTFHKATQVILSLYHDPFSPLFRQVMTQEDICAALLAAVLHDIGQFPLAHDLEEIAPSTFDHKQLGERILANAVADEESEFSKALKLWDVQRERIVSILRADLKASDAPFKDRLLHSIIDGPLDADKLDYLQRDTDRLRVPYGNGIDQDRILRGLTVIVTAKGRDGVVCVGVHEKARVSAEFVAIARYALFSQAYWHHSVRSMKAMLARCTLAILEAVGTKEGVLTWRNSFERFVIALPGALYATAGEGVVTLPPIAAKILAEAQASTISACDAAVIGYLLGDCARLSLEEGELLKDLLHRTIYKRAFVFSPDRSAEVWRDFTDRWESLKTHQKLDVYTNIETWILKECRELRSRLGDHTSFTVTDVDKLIGRLEQRRPTILIDVPGHRPGADVALHFVVEAQRRSLRKDERVVGEPQPSAVWTQFGSNLRERAGKLRIYVHPDHIDVFEAAVTRTMFEDYSRKVLQSY